MSEYDEEIMKILALLDKYGEYIQDMEGRLFYLCNDDGLPFNRGVVYPIIRNGPMIGLLSRMGDMKPKIFSAVWAQVRYRAMSVTPRRYPCFVETRKENGDRVIRIDTFRGTYVEVTVDGWVELVNGEGSTFIPPKVPVECFPTLHPPGDGSLPINDAEWHELMNPVETVPGFTDMTETILFSIFLAHSCFRKPIIHMGSTNASWGAGFILILNTLLFGSSTASVIDGKIAGAAELSLPVTCLTATSDTIRLDEERAIERICTGEGSKYPLFIMAGNETVSFSRYRLLRHVLRVPENGSASIAENNETGRHFRSLEDRLNFCRKNRGAILSSLFTRLSDILHEGGSFRNHWVDELAPLLDRFDYATWTEQVLQIRLYLLHQKGADESAIRQGLKDDLISWITANREADPWITALVGVLNNGRDPTQSYRRSELYKLLSDACPDGPTVTEGALIGRIKRSLPVLEEYGWTLDGKRLVDRTDTAGNRTRINVWDFRQTRQVAPFPFSPYKNRRSPDRTTTDVYGTEDIDGQPSLGKV